MRLIQLVSLIVIAVFAPLTCYLLGCAALYLRASMLYSLARSAYTRSDLPTGDSLKERGDRFVAIADSLTLQRFIGGKGD